jgi:hypothetical protein
LEESAGYGRALLLAAGDVGRTPMKMRSQTEISQHERRRLLVPVRKTKKRPPPGIAAEPSAQDIPQNAAVL